MLIDLAIHITNLRPWIYAMLLVGVGIFIANLDSLASGALHIQAATGTSCVITHLIRETGTYRICSFIINMLDSLT